MAVFLSSKFIMFFAFTCTCDLVCSCPTLVFGDLVCSSINSYTCNGISLSFIDEYVIFVVSSPFKMIKIVIGCLYV